MEPVLKATENWLTTTALVTDEIWQAVSETGARISLQAVTSASDADIGPLSGYQGTRLQFEDSRVIKAGSVVRYRSIRGVCAISREPV